MCVDKNSSEWEEPQQNEEVKKCELEICILHSTAWAHPFIHEHEKCLIIHMVMIQERTTDTKSISKAAWLPFTICQSCHLMNHSLIELPPELGAMLLKDLFACVVYGQRMYICTYRNICTYIWAAGVRGGAQSESGWVLLTPDCSFPALSGHCSLYIEINYVCYLSSVLNACCNITLLQWFCLGDILLGETELPFCPLFPVQTKKMPIWMVPIFSL